MRALPLKSMKLSGEAKARQLPHQNLQKQVMAAAGAHARLQLHSSKALFKIKLSSAGVVLFLPLR
jgi:hypothetical protein